MQSLMVRRTDGVTSEPIGERVVILSADGRRMTTLNPTGAFLWSMLTDAHTPAELAEVLQARYPTVEADIIHADVADLLDELRELNLIASDSATTAESGADEPGATTT